MWGMSPEAVVASVAALISLIALFDRFWSRGRQRELDPLKLRLDHLDKCLDEIKADQKENATAAADFRGDLREELRSIVIQVGGVQVTALATFATKTEIEHRLADLRSEIDVAGRITELTNHVRRNRS